MKTKSRIKKLRKSRIRRDIDKYEESAPDFVDMLGGEHNRLGGLARQQRYGDNLGDKKNWIQEGKPKHEATLVDWFRW